MKLKDLVLEIINESQMGYIPVWMSRDGTAKRVSSHADFGAEYLGGNLNPTDFNDIEKIYDGMYDRGFVRVTIEPNQVMFDYGDNRPVRKQLSSLRDTGIENNIPVSDAVTGRILYSPYN